MANATSSIEALTNREYKYTNVESDVIPRNYLFPYPELRL